MKVHRRATELTAEVVNAWQDSRLDAAWAAALLEREPLPIQHERRADEAAGADLVAPLAALARDAAPVFRAPNLADAAAALNAPLATINVQVGIWIGEAYEPHLHFDAHDSSLAQRLRVNCLVAMATLLADPAGLLRAGTCDAGACDDVFVDFTRSGHQRFCSRRCATRRHVREHRQRTATAS